MKVKVDNEKVGLKLNIQKMKIMASGPITPWEIGGETVSECFKKLLVIISLFYYAEYIMRNCGLEEAQAEVKIAGRNINNLRYADDTTLMAESEKELKSLLMKVKEESERPTTGGKTGSRMYCVIQRIYPIFCNNCIHCKD